MKKKKIAVIGVRGIPATFGGIEKHCEILYPLLINKGFDVDLYARDYYCEKNITEYNGVKIKTIPIINIKGLETFIYSFIATILATFSNADIIHFHAQGPALFSFIPAAFVPQKKIIFTCHGIDKNRDKWGKIGKFIISLGEKASAKFPHLKIGVSEHLKEYYENNYNIEMHKIYNGVNIQENLPLYAAKRFHIKENEYFIFVGRLVPEKAPETLIKAFKTVKTDKKLLIVGDSADTDGYVKSLKDLAKDDSRIVFTSYVYGDELTELYSNAFAYLSASKLEGLPLTLLEALSFSIPVVISNIPPHIEVLNQGYSIGLSFNVNNIEDCSNSINKMLNFSQAQIQEMRNASFQIIKDKFDWEKVSEQTSQLINASVDNVENDEFIFKIFSNIRNSIKTIISREKGSAQEESKIKEKSNK